MVKFMFFAQLADYAGRDSVMLAFKRGRVVREYLVDLTEQIPAHAINAVTDDATMLSINQVFASWDDELSDGDEVGLLPPFSGG